MSLSNNINEIQEFNEVTKWFRLAAEQGYSAIQSYIGNYSENGINIMQNNDIESIKWVGLAAKHGLAVAQYNIGLCYETGNGVAPNRNEAMKWYKLAADNGSEPGIENYDRLKAKTLKTAT